MKGDNNMSGIAGVCENLINKGRITGMKDKLNRLMLYGQITQEEYAALMEKLNNN